MSDETFIPEDHLRGFITERDFDKAEEIFPGIGSFYEHCRRKPATFLNLVWQFEKAFPDLVTPQGSLRTAERDLSEVAPSRRCVRVSDRD